jgi:hypothetical protein
VVALTYFRERERKQNVKFRLLTTYKQVCLSLLRRRFLWAWFGLEDTQKKVRASLHLQHGESSQKCSRGAYRLHNDALVLSAICTVRTGSYSRVYFATDVYESIQCTDKNHMNLCCTEHLCCIAHKHKVEFLYEYCTSLTTISNCRIR